MKVVWFLQSVAGAIGDLVVAIVNRRMSRLLVLLPILLVLALGLALVSSSGVLAPFLYPLF